MIFMMAAYDDRLWMLYLIQNAYVTSDDTGLCESILKTDVAKEHISEFDFFTDENFSICNSEIEPDQHSPDVSAVWNKGRHRSYTERKSEKMKKEKEKRSQIKRVTWNHNPKAEIAEDRQEMFQLKPFIQLDIDEIHRNKALKSLGQTSTEINDKLIPSLAKFEVKGDSHNLLLNKNDNHYLSSLESSDNSLDYNTQLPRFKNRLKDRNVGNVCSVRNNSKVNSLYVDVVDSVSKPSASTVDSSDGTSILSETRLGFSKSKEGQRDSGDHILAQTKIKYSTHHDPELSSDSSLFHKPKVKSLLAHLLTTQENCISNNYIEFAKFDGITNNNVPTKTINIYIYHGPTCPNYPVKVCVISSAKFSDLIGVTCWIYAKQNYQPALKPVEYYQLFIAEEDGSYDPEFLALDKAYPIEKCGFTTLAMVEMSKPSDLESIVVTVNFSDGAFSKLEVPSSEVSLQEILDKAISKRRDILKLKESGVTYHLEKESEPGIVLDKRKSLYQVACKDFAVVRDNSKRETRDQAFNSHSFSVTWHQKFSKNDSNLEINDRYVMMKPLSSNLSSSFLKLRPIQCVRYHIAQLVDCNVKPTKKGRSELRLIFKGEHSFKQFLFSCVQPTAQSIENVCKSFLKKNLKMPEDAELLDWDSSNNFDSKLDLESEKIEFEREKNKLVKSSTKSKESSKEKNFSKRPSLSLKKKNI